LSARALARRAGGDDCGRDVRLAPAATPSLSASTRFP
jgi:hypothetical protein